MLSWPFPTRKRARWPWRRFTYNISGRRPGCGQCSQSRGIGLGPTIARVRENIKRATQQSESNPETADQVARDLVTETLPLVAIFDLFFGPAEHPAKDILDDVASTSHSCLVDYQNKTGGNKTFVELLEPTLGLAKRDKVRDPIQKNIEFGKRMLLRELLQAIRVSTTPPSERLKRFQLEAVQPLLTATANLEPNSELRNGLLDDAAGVLISISAEAWNKFRDKKTAVKANDLAFQYVCDAQLRQTMEKNRMSLSIKNRLRQEVLENLPENFPLVAGSGSRFLSSMDASNLAIPEGGTQQWFSPVVHHRYRFDSLVAGAFRRA